MLDTANSSSLGAQRAFRRGKVERDGFVRVMAHSLMVSGPPLHGYDTEWFLANSDVSPSLGLVTVAVTNVPRTSDTLGRILHAPAEVVVPLPTKRRAWPCPLTSAVLGTEKISTLHDAHDELPTTNFAFDVLTLGQSMYPFGRALAALDKQCVGPSPLSEMPPRRFP